MTPEDAPDPELDPEAPYVGPGQRVFNRCILKRILSRSEGIIVWLAWDEQLKVEIALKYLPAFVCRDLIRVQEVRQDVARIVPLEHRHIARVYALLEDDWSMAIAMEHVEGSSLAVRLASHPSRHFEGDEILPWIRSALAGLAYAHESAGRCHGVVNPSNLVVTAQGELKLTRFGMPSNYFDTVEGPMRRPSGMEDEFHYLSPQLLVGEALTVADDIYAIGATVYALLSGEVPFELTKSIGELAARVAEPMSAARRRVGSPSWKDVSPEWERWVADCLAYDPARRPGSVAALLDRLPRESAAASLHAALPPSFAMADDFSGKTVVGFYAGLIVFGRYRLLRELGRGGMGVVWLARDEELGEEIALKFLAAAVVADATAVDDLKRETKKSRRLTHPHIVRIHGFENSGGFAAVSMEVVAGRTLLDLRMSTETRVFGVAQLRPWVRQLAEALDYAHEKVQVVHRDLKPANLMLTEAGDIKVLDFGIAAAVNESTARLSRLAASGTPTYMSPQQMRGQSPTVADDIYALGATLYDLLTGRPPFFRGDVAHQVLHDVPPTIAERRAELGVVGGEVIPAEWEATIAACLAKEPQDRPKSAGEVAARLEGKFNSSVPRSAGDDRKTKGTGLPLRFKEWVAKMSPRKRRAALAALAVGVVGAGFFWGTYDPSQAKQTELAGSVSVGNPATGYFENSLGMKFVPVSGTEGLFSIWETREQDYAAFARATNRAWTRVNAGATHPAVNVSWDDAQAFCAWLTTKERQEGKIGRDRSYRLPTDREWSTAVGLIEMPSWTPREKDQLREKSLGLLKNEYPWGTQWPPPSGAGNYGAALNVDSYAGTAPVGSFAANRHGLYDLGGNVWEWVEDREYALSTNRVLRGGSARSDAPGNLVSSDRIFASPGVRDSYYGFRVVLAVEQKKAGGSAPTVSRPQLGVKWTIPDLGLELMPIAAGSFAMGRANSGSANLFDNESPVTRVTLTRPYWLGKTEVTQRQWEVIMGNNPSHFKGTNRPVENVSWEDAMAYAKKVTERERAAGRLPSGYEYTLPTEAQWEYACRAGTTGDYAGNLDEMGWYETNSGKQTHEVGLKRANAWGLYDMHGNVFEWCRDWYGIYPGGNVTDPWGASSGQLHVGRGGGWNSSISGCRSPFRSWGGRLTGNHGVRLALSAVR